MDLQPVDFLIYGLPLLLAIPLHEAAHGFVAHRCGDPTAYLQGRVTFNPLRHIDPVGTLLLPVMLILAQAPFVFGWAKPVPVNFANLRHLRRDMVLVAAAGPGINLLLAILSAVALRFTLADVALATSVPWHAQMLFFSLMLNVTLAVFNMIPLLPLDGGRVLTGLLPPSLARPFSRTERFGFPLLIGVLVLPPLLGQLFGQDWSLFGLLLAPPIHGLISGIAALVGLDI
jgi:Zn-dependent protease